MSTEQDLWTRFSGVPRNELEQLVVDLEAKLAKVERDRDVYCTTLTHVQRRCTELLLEARDTRQVDVSGPGQLKVLADVVRERLHQDEKWGPIETRADIPDGTGDTLPEVPPGLFEKRLELRRIDVQVHCGQTGRQTCCWAHVLDEECAEALVEFDPEKLRAELVQVAASACCWVEAMDNRAKGTGLR